MERNLKIGVYGLGRFGYFWAGLLAEHFHVKAYSRNPERTPPPGVERVSEDELLKLPVLIICTAISAFEEVIRRIATRILPGTLLMDTCSVKQHPIRIMEKYISDDIEILATHPMFGPDSAINGLADLAIILCPVRIEQGKMAEWKNFFGRLGLRVLVMASDEHDREAAYTQGITHYIGRVLADLGLKDSKIATVGYGKLLEIMDQTCNDPWQLFLDLQRYNPYTEEMRKKLNLSLAKIMRTLDNP